VSPNYRRTSPYQFRPIYMCVARTINAPRLAGINAGINLGIAARITTGIATGIIAAIALINMWPATGALALDKTKTSLRISTKLKSDAQSAAGKPAAPYPARTIHFPFKYCFGDVFLLEPHLECNEWAKCKSGTRFAAARGLVAIPAGAMVRLYVRYDGGLNVAPLADVQGDDIQSLDLTRVEMRNDTGRYVSRLNGLKELFASDTEAGDDFVHDLPALHNLQCLILNRTTITDKGLEDVAKLNNLKILSLASNSLSDKGMASLSKLKSLISLRLEKADLTDAGLKSLESLKNLRCLMLDETKITDAGLASIAKLDGLSRLEIAGTGVRGPGLPALGKLTHLTSVKISEKTVAPHYVALLQKQLPHCLVSNEEKRNKENWVPLLH
jgi:hypothetical protein